MSVDVFLTELRQSNVRIWLDGGQLRCKAPKGVLTKQLAAQIAERKSEIVEYLNAIQVDAEEIPRPTSFDRSGDLPLSFAQERLWFLYQLEPDSSAYNLTASRRFHDVVDTDILQKALDEVAVRHEVLRSTYPGRGGNPAQVVGPATPVPLVIHDLRKRNLEDREQVLQGIAQDESHEVFDLENGPVFRARLALLQDNECVLYVSLPHITADGWSMGVLLEQLVLIYAKYASDSDENLPAIPVQYGDFVQWQRSWLTQQRLDLLLDYWKKQVEGAPLLLPFLAQRRRTHSASMSGAVEVFRFSPELSEQIKQISRRLQVTDFVTLFSIYSLVLARYSAVKDVLVGIPIANRNWLEFEKMIGLFANTLALHADCNGSQTVAEYLRRNHHMLLDAYSHQDLPFEKLVEAVNPERVPGVPPIFQATFVFQNTPLSNEFTMISGGSMFDLTCYIHDTPDGFRGALEYNTAILDRAIAEELVDSIQVVAEQLVADKQQHIRDLAVISSAQHRSMLGEWNDTRRMFRHDVTIAARFEEIVSQRSADTALESVDLTLSYAELNAAANRLAHLLMEHGVRPGDRVMLCLDRSPEIVIAILATLKVQAIYVPVDPEYPAERIKILIGDCEPRLILIDNNTDLEEDSLLEIARLNVGDPDLVGQSEFNPEVEGNAADAAYMMYTSGSTGTPKGVLVTHRNIMSLVDGADYIDFGPDQTFLLLAPAFFDASTFELWGALLNGGRCVVYSERVPNVSTLGQIIQNYEISGLFLTTALFNTIIDTASEILQPLHWLLFGGEAHSVDHIERALDALPDTQVSQVYGPTECTTFATASKLKLGPDNRLTNLPVAIGAPISNTTAFVVDEGGQLTPPGVVGELYLGGDGVAAGYWQRPELTAKRFVSKSFDGELPMRLYRTGDQVRWLPNGELEFIGRQDFQIKLRGFRVELGEVEFALRELTEVVDAVVTLREDSPGDKRIVAYVIPFAADSFDSEETRTNLQSRLPDYMLPSAFVTLKEYPLTANGKVDRGALPVPNYYSEELSEPKQMPASPLEVQIAALWQQALDCHDLGIDENFFDIGGNSLIAVRLFVQLEQVTGQKLPLSTLFKAPTIRSLAKVLSSGGRKPLWDCLVGIQPLGSRDPIFLVPGVGGNVLSFDRLTKLLGSEQPVYGLQSRGLDGEQPPFTRAEEMAAHFIEEIQKVRPHGPYIIGGACMGGIVAYEMAQQLQKAGEDVSALMLIETASPIALQPGRRKLQSLFHPIVFLYQAAMRHLHAMRDLSFKERWKYISDKAGIMTEMIRHRDVYRGDRSYFYQDLVSNANYEIMANYVPKDYPGHIHLYLASKRPIDPARDTRMDWCELAEGGFSVKRIAATDSGRLFMEPWVSKLAEQIQNTIENRNAG